MALFGKLFGGHKEKEEENVWQGKYQYPFADLTIQPDYRLDNLYTGEQSDT